MSNIYLKGIVILLFSLLLVNSSSCVLDKVNTNIVVFGNFDQEIGKLDIESKLTYVNTDTGEKKPIVGKEIIIQVNITKNSGVNESIEKSVITNGLGWGKRTFYLEDVKEYQVMVKFSGDGTFKESFGTLGGGGDYEQQNYTTSLPEGISLTTCLPVLLLIGFLGAAMYASGGNPFGFVDMTTNRGFRMNRNLRKVLFVQGLGGSIASYASKGIQVAMAAVAKSKTKDSKKEGDENKGKENEKEVKKPEEKGSNSGTGRVNTATPNTTVAPTTTPKETKGKNVDKGMEKQANIETKSPTKKTESVDVGSNVSKAFRITSKVLFVLGSLFSGQVQSMNYIDNVIKIQSAKNREEMEKKQTTIGTVKSKAEIIKNNGKKQIEKNKSQIEKCDTEKKKLENKLKETKEKLVPGVTKEEAQKLKDQIKTLKSKINNLEKVVDGLKNENKYILKDMKSSEKLIEKINELQKDSKLGDNTSINSLEFSKTLDPKNKEIGDALKEMESVVEGSRMVSNYANFSVAIQYNDLKNELKNADPKMKEEIQNQLDKIKSENPNVEIEYKEYQKRIGIEDYKTAKYINENGEKGLNTVVQLDKNNEIQKEENEKILKEYKRELENKSKKELDDIDLAKDIKDGKVKPIILEESEKYNKYVEEAKERIQSGRGNKEDENIVKEYGDLSKEDLIRKIASEAKERIISGSGTKSDIEMVNELNGVLKAMKIDSDVKKTEEYYATKQKQIESYFNGLVKEGADVKEIDKLMSKTLEGLKDEKIETLNIVNNQLSREEFNTDMNIRNIRNMELSNEIGINKQILNPDNKDISEDYVKSSYDDVVKREREIMELQKKIGIKSDVEVEEFNIRNKLWEKETAREFEYKMNENLITNEKVSTDYYIRSYGIMNNFESESDKEGILGQKIVGKIDNEIRKVDEAIENTKKAKQEVAGTREASSYDDDIKDLENKKKKLEKNIESIETLMYFKNKERITNNEENKEIKEAKEVKRKIEEKYKYEEKNLSPDKLYTEDMKKGIEDVKDNVEEEREKFFKNLGKKKKKD